jgi:exonuclease VII small subunit
LPPLTVSENETRIKELEQRVRELELQNATLEKALKLVGGR